MLLVIVDVFRTFAAVGSQNKEAFAIFSQIDFGIIVYSILVFLTNITLFYITSYWTILSHIFYWLTLVVYIAVLVAYHFIALSIYAAEDRYMG